MAAETYVSQRLNSLLEGAINEITLLEFEKFPLASKKIEALFMTAHKVHLRAREELRTEGLIQNRPLKQVKEEAKDIKTDIRKLVHNPAGTALFYQLLEDRLQHSENFPNDLFRNMLHACSTITQDQILDMIQPSVSAPSANQS